MLRLVVDDPDMLFQEYKSRGVFRKGTELPSTSWGSREFAFWDPNHNGLLFVRDSVSANRSERGAHEQ